MSGYTCESCGHDYYSHLLICESCFNIACERAKQVKTTSEENTRLKDVLFVIGERAVNSFDDAIVGIVDRALKGYSPPANRYLELKDSLLND
jgi:hypothetical protein